MTDSATYERLRDIIADTLKVDREKVTAEASFSDDLKADSLDLVELIMAFEDEYGVEIPDEEAQNIRTVGQALEYVQKAEQAKSS
jgi:acyl carrier protein